MECCCNTRYNRRKHNRQLLDKPRTVRPQMSYHPYPYVFWHLLFAAIIAAVYGIYKLFSFLF